MPMMEKRPEKEEVAWILDYLPMGHTDIKQHGYQKKPLVQAVGEKQFTLMDIYTEEEISPETREKIDLKGDKIIQIRRISYKNLTNGSQKELPHIIEKIVRKDEERFIDFFNTAYPLTTRLHMLELLPGIGKKLMWAVIEEREKGKFKSFQELVERVKGLHMPERLIAHRIEEELKDDNIKYRVFTTLPRHAREKETPIRHKRH